MLAIVLAVGCFLVWRGLQFRQLALHGVVAEAVISKKARLAAGADHVGAGRISYAFRAADGREYHRSSTISEAKWAELSNGQTIEIVYLPNRPSISAPAWLVDDARTALGE